jgi:hypothetical protein
VLGPFSLSVNGPSIWLHPSLRSFIFVDESCSIGGFLTLSPDLYLSPAASDTKTTRANITRTH